VFACVGVKTGSPGGGGGKCPGVGGVTSGGGGGVNVRGGHYVRGVGD
jgi:hypothetical protein